MAIRPEFFYTPYYTSSREKTGDKIMFEQFEEGNLISKSCNGTESGDKYDDNSTITPLISEAEMDEISLGDEYNDEPMSTDILEEICEGNQSYPRINSREAHYKIRD